LSFPAGEEGKWRGEYISSSSPLLGGPLKSVEGVPFYIFCYERKTTVYFILPIEDSVLFCIVVWYVAMLFLVPFPFLFLCRLPCELFPASSGVVGVFQVSSIPFVSRCFPIDRWALAVISFFSYPILILLPYILEGDCC
jgi:hypothetical protein